jgi:hypothetical protein
MHSISLVIQLYMFGWWICRNSIVFTCPPRKAHFIHHFGSFVGWCLQSSHKFLLSFIIQFKPFGTSLQAFIPAFCLAIRTLLLYTIINILKSKLLLKDLSQPNHNLFALGALTELWICVGHVLWVDIHFIQACIISFNRSISARLSLRLSKLRTCLFALI